MTYKGSTRCLGWFLRLCICNNLKQGIYIIQDVWKWQPFSSMAKLVQVGYGHIEQLRGISVASHNVIN